MAHNLTWPLPPNCWPGLTVIDVVGVKSAATRPPVTVKNGLVAKPHSQDFHAQAQPHAFVRTLATNNFVRPVENSQNGSMFLYGFV